MCNVLICDDHKHTRKMLEKIASENPLTNNIFTAEDGVGAVKVAKQEEIDIALLDIDMPNLNGIDTAKLISKMSPETRFVFITAHMEYAIDSFAVHPYNYLLKPIHIGGLKETLNELMVKNKNSLKQSININMIAVKNKGNAFMIPVMDVIFFEKIGKNTIVHTEKDEYSITKTLTELENSLNSKFLRVHQSFIVNSDKITKIQDVGNRSYCIKFNVTKKVAYMSRYKFESFKKTSSFI
ncbi:MAG: response regulator transcription factor [Clostridiaceae bacterium]|nr:response regulator transcription factor [Clostridiaceae bacterium]